ncbi:SPRY domain-containing SOCS box protein 3-like [Stegodyphus dumicola]|uniref:SPRY domain-containing SOCS box protein 3-like n=1 Tax=Stegodyphus dumicola TaxID=202533 RepID=UPI0015B11306|nr:SPRY domain-containing SOCS box protein 3-like [Stegodyphus dumicola]
MFDWTWHEEENSNFLEIRDDNKDVIFHPRLSNGTAVVRGTKAMSNGQHYWEVEMASPVYGTDVMIGVGTSDADISQVRDRFVSLLGMDNKTWGLSYTGQFHHDGLARDYAPRFVLGSIIGVHLDMWNGTLSFYKNRKNLGVASRGLNGKSLYAMASSTAARSRMRIIRSCSFPSSLQFLCCSRLREMIPEEKSVLDAIKVPPGLRLFLQNNLSWLLDKRNLDDQPLNCDSSQFRDTRYTSQPSPEYEFNQNMYEEIRFGDSAESNWEIFFPALDPFVMGIGQSQHTIMGCGPYFLHNYNRFQRVERPLEQHEENVEVSRNPSVDRSGSSHNSFEVSNEENIEDEDTSESSSKRRRHSYNYVMGLSDPDSD